MGCSSSNTLVKGSSKNCIVNSTEKEENEEEIERKSDSNDKKQSLFETYKFEVANLANSNLLLYTNFLNANNEFNSMLERGKEKSEKNSFKSSNHGIALGYKKGYKLEFVNQDKFFVVLDNHLEAYCIIDGHGPFGNKVAQIAQDLLIKFVTEINRDTFDEGYEKNFENLFENINQYIMNREEKNYGNYDPFLSGVAVTILIKMYNTIFCANVGNVLAIIFNSDKLMPSRFNITELTFNDSNFSEENLNMQKPVENRENPDTSIENLINPNEINFEIRRIYEHGGELRKLQGETKSRIFVKGKYFPGLINTRSLGDQIGKGIGVISTPHISKIKLSKDKNYFILMCSDGISNVISTDKLVHLFQANDTCKIYYITYSVT